jgi:hypothetical protein
MPISDETRNQIFEKLKKAMDNCSPPMVRSNKVEHHDYGLIGNKPVPYGFDKKIIPGMFFASIAQRKDSVAFHFFPSYMDPGLKEIAPSLYKFLKGKTCFHFKKSEDINDKELKAMLKKGVDNWVKAGYMK